MSSMFKVRWDNEAPQIIIERFDGPTYCCDLDTEEKPWYYYVKRYLETQEYPAGASVNDKKCLRRFASKFFLSNGILYKRNCDLFLLRCVDQKTAEQIMEDLHEGALGRTYNG